MKSVASTRQTKPSANDSANAKSHARDNLCSQGKFELHSKSEIVNWVSRLIVIRELKAKTTVTATRTSKKQ